MIRPYETARGDCSPAELLTPEEALDLHERKLLCACDYRNLGMEAAAAVCWRIETTVRGTRMGRVKFWGIKVRQVVVQEGEA